MSCALSNAREEGVGRYTPPERRAAARIDIANGGTTMDFNLLIARVKNILLTPKTEWPVIATETTSVADIYKNYVIWLAAIGPIASFIGQSVFGISIPFVGTYRPGMGSLITTLVLTYAMSLGMVYLLAHVCDALAPTFGGQKNFLQALKLTAYGYPAAFVAGIFGIVPQLAILSLVGLYSLYLIFLGLPHLMRNPAEKTVGYMVAVAIIGIILTLILGAIIGAATTVGMRSGIAGVTAPDSGEFAADPDSPLGKLAAMGAQMEAAGAKVEAANAAAEVARASGDGKAAAEASAAAMGAAMGALAGGKPGVRAMAPDALKPYLPESMAGMPRSSVSASRNAAMGMEVSTATANYGAGQRSLEVEIMDMAGAPNFLAFAGLAGLESENETDTRVEKTYQRDGSWVQESWDKDGSRSEYQIALNNRFMVKLRGTGIDIDTLKGTLSELDLDGLSSSPAEG